VAGRAPDRAAAGRRPPGLARGVTLEIDLTAMALDGDAVAKASGYAVLVAGAIPGERVEVEIVSAGRKFARGRLRRILRASPHRVTPPCRHFGPCGGCSWQHIAYEEQLRLKQGMLATTLERALGAPVKVLPAVGIAAAGGPGPWAYRNKAHFVLAPGRDGRGLVMGHYRRGSREPVEVEECPVHPPEGNRIAFLARDLLRKHGVPGARVEPPGPAILSRGAARHIVVRTSERTGGAHATIVATEESPGILAAARELAGAGGALRGVHINLNDRPGPYILGARSRKVAGEERLLEEVAGVRFLVGPRSFFQTSVRSAEKLVQSVLRRVPDDGKPVLDLQAGSGLFSLPLARRGHEVVAVEENPAAVADAVASLALNGIDARRCRFVRARAEDWVRDEGAPGQGGPAFEAVILDPPRDGCPPGLIRAIREAWRPARIVYVSCNPRALATNLREAMAEGYRVEEIEPVDMFPHTAHIEAVVLLIRGGAPVSARKAGARRSGASPAGRSRRGGRPRPRS
jgi:23S rRNA (uracil1939-C5)-methyltransferase